MIKLTLGSSSADGDDSEELLFSKRLRSRVRLPPLSTTEIIRNPGSLERKIRVEGKGKESGTFAKKPRSPGTENVLFAPDVSLQPASPSNLSIQFSFEEVSRDETKQPVACNAREVKAKRTIANNKWLQRTKPSSSGNKGYHILENADQTRPSPFSGEEATTVKAGRYRQALVDTSALNSPCKPRERQPDVESIKARRISVDRLGVNTTNKGERKGSTYDLQEFLSLPAELDRAKTSPALNKKDSVKASAGEKKRTQYLTLTKSSWKVSQRQYPSRNKLDDRKYDLSEFLALSATENDRPSTTGKRNKKPKELKNKQSSNLDNAMTSRKTGIPSVVVADWSLNEDTTRAERLPRRSRELPKANFPRDDFPAGHAGGLPGSCDRVHRASVYDLKEFLTRSTTERSRNGTAKMSTEDLKMLSKEYYPGGRRETEYDLREFLTFLDSRAASNDGGSGLLQSRPQTSDSDLFRNRNVSVYDIYEFLKVTKSPTASPRPGTKDDEFKFQMTSDSELTSEHPKIAGRRKLSIIDLSEQFGKSLGDNVLLENTPRGTDEAKALDISYNLREFLKLPVGRETGNSKGKSLRH